MLLPLMFNPKPIIEVCGNPAVLAQTSHTFRLKPPTVLTGV